MFVDDEVAVSMTAARYADASWRMVTRSCPAELAALVHLESVAFIDELRADCLARGENIVIEGTLSWPPAARQLLDELVKREYREVVIVDVEVPREGAHNQALDRWWQGRQERIAGRGQGGRFVPARAVDHAFTAADVRAAGLAAGWATPSGDYRSSASTC